MEAVFMLIAVTVGVGVLTLVFALVWRNRTRIDFRVIDERGTPVQGLDVFAVSFEANTASGTTASGESVTVQGSGGQDVLQRVGSTDADGRFRKTYVMANVAFIAFRVAGQALPYQQFPVAQLAQAGMRTVRRTPSGKLKL